MDKDSVKRYLSGIFTEKEIDGIYELGSSFYRLQQIKQLRESINLIKRLAYYKIRLGASSDSCRSQIMRMEIELDNLYVKWIKGEIN
jgi:hypothetical protein